MLLVLLFIIVLFPAYAGQIGSTSTDNPNYLKLDGTRPMRGDLNMNGYTIIGQGNANISGYLRLDGTSAMSGNLNMNGHSIENLNTNSITFSNGAKVTSGRFDEFGNINSTLLAGYTPEQLIDLFALTGLSFNYPLIKYANNNVFVEQASNLNSGFLDNYNFQLFSEKFVSFPYYDRVYVSKNSTYDNANQTGDITRPFKTIQQGIDYFGQPQNANDYQRKAIIQILDGGVYREELTIPHRGLSIFAEGVTIEGNINRCVDDNLEFGVSSSTFRSYFALVGARSSDVYGRDTQRARTTGAVLSGNYREEVCAGGVGFTTHDFILNSIRVSGYINSNYATGNSVAYILNARIVGGYTGGFYNQRIVNSEFNGLVDVAFIVNTENVLFEGPLKFTTSVVENGWINTIFEDTLTANGQTIKMDGITKSSYDAASVSGTNTITYMVIDSATMNTSNANCNNVMGAINWLTNKNWFGPQVITKQAAAGYPSPDYSQFEPDGTLIFNGNATTWEDIYIPVANLRPGNTPPVYDDFGDGIYQARFDNAANDEVHGEFEIPHSWKVGSALPLHIHWTPSTTDIGNANFQFIYRIANTNSIYPPAEIITAIITGNGNLNYHQYNELGNLNITGINFGAHVLFKFIRNGTADDDDATYNAWVHDIGIHYQKDKTGSRNEYD